MYEDSSFYITHIFYAQLPYLEINLKLYEKTLKILNKEICIKMNVNEYLFISLSVVTKMKQGKAT